MKKGIVKVMVFFPLAIWAEHYLIRGGQESAIRYALTQRLEPAGKTDYLKMSFVIPQDFQSPTYRQRIESLRLSANPPPDKREEETDKRGNPIVRLEWRGVRGPVDVTLSFVAKNTTLLKPLSSTAPFPLPEVPAEFRDYLRPTAQVQSNAPEIQAKSRELIIGVKTEFDAVQRILSWIVDHLRYVTPPEQYDALYSFRYGKGNCQNYSHLAAALLRVAGIPVRIVNGVTLKQPYTIKTRDGEFTFKMGQGRHSWIEVWFPDLGWVPFDPQQTELFVSNRFIRCEVGVDNEETIQDGMVKYKQPAGMETPVFQEIIEADFDLDRIDLSMEKQNHGPKNMLLLPPIQAVYTPVQVAPPPPPPPISRDRLETLRYTERFVFGNLDFPIGVNFFNPRGASSRGDQGEVEMRKNFLVETAEYVTTQLTQYAQVFVLQRPIKLQTIGLALHKFGGSGQVWIDLMDDQNGKPGPVIATSDFIHLEDIPAKQGYDWVSFDLSRSDLILPPGRYWIGFGFTGSPIINWFYTYGKPVGPVDGTRYKGIYDAEWSGALSYEFNYRVIGLAAQ